MVGAEQLRVDLRWSEEIARAIKQVSEGEIAAIEVFRSGVG